MCSATALAKETLLSCLNKAACSTFLALLELDECILISVSWQERAEAHVLVCTLSCRVQMKCMYAQLVSCTPMAF